MKSRFWQKINEFPLLRGVPQSHFEYYILQIELVPTLFPEGCRGGGGEEAVHLIRDSFPDLFNNLQPMRVIMATGIP